MFNFLLIPVRTICKESCIILSFVDERNNYYQHIILEKTKKKSIISNV